MDYITWGGMPQRFQFGTVEETKVFLNDLRDIFERGKIRDIDVLNRIIEYIVSNPSQTFSPSSIGKYFESVNIAPHCEMNSDIN